MKQLLIIAVMSLTLTIAAGASAEDTDTGAPEKEKGTETETEAPATGPDDAEAEETPTDNSAAATDTEKTESDEKAASNASGTEPKNETKIEAEDGAAAKVETEGTAEVEAETEPAKTPAKTPVETKKETDAKSEKVAPGPPKPVPGPRFSLQPDPPYTSVSLAEYNRQYEKNRRLQVMGKSMLAASFAMELIGAIVIEAAPWGPVGWAAFGVVGTGVAHFIASAFMLGFSKPPHHLAPPRREMALASDSGDIIF